jgi:hypothetical protein
MKGYRTILLGIYLLTVAFLPSEAAEPTIKEPEHRPPPQAPSAHDQEAARRSMEQFLQEMEKNQMQYLEQMKESFPKEYEKMKAALDRQKQISQIVVAFRKGSLPEADARSRLYPLAEKQVQDEISQIPEEIKRLKKRLKELEAFQFNHSLLVKKRIDELLGKLLPTAEEIPY